MAESSDNASKRAKGGGPPPMPRTRSASGSLDNEIDAVADLFRADQTLRAPSLPAEPSAAEATRKRGARASLFEESVADPLPVPPPAGAIPSRSAELRQPPAAGAPAERDSTRRSGVRDRARSDALELIHSVFPEQKAAAVAPAPPASPAAPADAAPKGEPESARRRVAHGPKPATLALLGGATVMTLATVAMVLGLIPKPWADQTQEAVGAVARPVAPSPMPALQPKPVAAPVPAEPKAEAPAPSATPSPVPPPSPVPQAAAAPDAPKAEPPAPSPAPAEVKAADPAPVAAVPVAAAPVAAAPVAAAPVAAAPAAAPPAARVPAEPVPAAARPAEPASEEPAAAPASGRVLASARKLLASDEPEKAEALLRDQLALDPSDHHTMELLARALMDQDRGAEAVPFAKKIVQRRPKRIPYRLLLGDLLLMAGDEAGARAAWKQALELDPGNAEIQRRLK